MASQALNQERNIEKVLGYGIRLGEENGWLAPPLDEGIDDDKLSRILNIAQDISNEEMQRLWGFILSAEFKHPGSFSLRTLEIIKNVNQSEARIFEKAAALIFSVDDVQISQQADTSKAGIFVFRSEKTKSECLTQWEMDQLLQAGFLLGAEHRFGTIPSNKEGIVSLRIGKERFEIKIPNGDRGLRTFYVPVTQAAVELAAVLAHKVPTIYIEDLSIVMHHCVVRRIGHAD